MALLVDNAAATDQRRPTTAAPLPAVYSEGAVKRWATTAVLGRYKHLGVMRLQETVRSWTAPPYATVLLFHRVTNEIPLDGLTVDRQWFSRFCKLMSKSYQVVSLAEIDRLMKSGDRPK